MHLWCAETKKINSERLSESGVLLKKNNSVNFCRLSAREMYQELVMHLCALKSIGGKLDCVAVLLQLQGGR